MLTKLRIAVAIAAMACCGNTFAQDCGCDGGYGGNYGYAPTSCGCAAGNCGREISQGDAASLWADYCTETCDTGCGMFGRLKGRGGCCTGRGCNTGGSAACGCDQGCFGYPAGASGCGCATDGCGTGAGLLSGFKGKIGGGLKGCCGLKGKRRGGCDSDCCGEAPVGFSGGCDTCGCSNGGSYFNQPVGYDYGTAGMHSNVQGCGTGACGGSNPNSYGTPAPNNAQPTQGPEIVGEAIQGATNGIEPGAIPAGEAAGN